MAGLGSRLAGLGWRRVAFTLLVLVPLVLYFGLFGFWRNQLLLVTSWFGGFGLLEPVFYEEAHRLHEFAAQLGFWPVLVGLLAQLRSPERHVTGMLMALAAIVAFAAGMVVSGFTAPLPIVAFLGVPTLLAALLHPAGRELVTAISPDRVNRVLLVLLVVAAVPMLAFAATQVGLQTGAIEPAHDHAGGGHAEEVHEQHLEYGHFMFTTSFVFAVLVTGLLSSLQQPGWRVGAAVTGLMVLAYALAGVLAPAAASNPGPLWNLAAVGWAVVFVGAAQLTGIDATPSPGHAGEPAR
jgi:MFS family permease